MVKIHSRKRSRIVVVLLIAFIMTACGGSLYAAPAKQNPNKQAASQKSNNSAAQIDQQLAEAKEALLNAGWLEPVEGQDENILTIVQSIVDNVSPGVTVKITTSRNSMIAKNGTITYGDSDTSGEVIFTLSKKKSTVQVSIPVTVTAGESMEEDLPDIDAEEVEAAGQALKDAAPLQPQEGIDSSIEELAQALVDEVVTGVKVKFIKSNNPQVDASGNIIYGAVPGTGSAVLMLSRSETQITVTIAVEVPARLESEVISCTELGMVQNDAGAGPKNMGLLSKAVREGREVLVDGVYYLKYPDQTPLTDGNIHLTGITGDAEFKLENGNPLFNIADQVNVNISNIRFTQTGTGVRYILKFAPSCLSDQVIIEGNSFIGKIRLMEFEGSTTINPAVQEFGIKEMSFVNNTVENASYSFIRLDDVPFDEIHVEDNTISNFDYTFFSSGITNNIRYISEMYNAKKLLVVRNNQVICDDDWWGNPSNTNYYCFVLFEGIDCVYESNHVEGLKYFSGSGSGAPVYDSYLSCENLTYVGNTWKNILNFNPAKENNTLLKSKGGPGRSVSRHYESNQFVIEESFIKMCSSQLAKKYSQDPTARLTQDLSASWIEFISLTTDCSTYEILDNTIDVYDLRLPRSSISVEQMNISGNQIKCKKIGGILLPYRVAGNKDYRNKTHTVSGNRIEAESLGPAGYFQLIKGIDITDRGNAQYGTIMAENNTIMAPCSYLIVETRVSNAVLRGNLVDTPGQATCKTYPDYCARYIDNLINENNTFI